MSGVQRHQPAKLALLVSQIGKLKQYSRCEGQQQGQHHNGC